MTSMYITVALLAILWILYLLKVPSTLTPDLPEVITITVIGFVFFLIKQWWFT